MTHLPLSITSAILLFLAAAYAGAINAVAGGGTFVTFPILLFTGVPPIPANATNTVALWTGLLFSGGAFRRHLKVQRAILLTLVGISLIGGGIGAVLLIRTPAQTFLRVLPWLMLAATLLFVFGRRLISPVRNAGTNVTPKMLLVASLFQFLVGIYGGYFGGGMGFVILAMLSAFGMADMHEMNAFKVILSSSINGLAVIVFIVERAVYWREAGIMLVGAAIGGYFGARYSLRLPEKWVRAFVAVVAAAVTTYFFVRAYTP